MLFAATLIAATLSLQSADPTLPPAGTRPAITVEARGVQIYTCMPQNQNRAFAWVFQAPEATLFDPSTHQPVGTHTAGPTWTWSDGSAIEGRILQKQPSPDAQAIPWLLLETHASGTTTGALSDVVYVRRSDTQAGAAPAEGCDAAHAGITLRVPYAARYTFYKKAQ